MISQAVPYVVWKSGPYTPGDIVGASMGFRCRLDVVVHEENVGSGDGFVVINQRARILCLQRLSCGDSIITITNDGFTVGWRFTVGGKTLEFYATGLRDLGCTFDLSHLPEGWTEQSWPAFRALTFIYTASGYELDSERTQAIIFALDERHTKIAGIGMHTAASSNGAYGMAVRPERTK